MKFFSSSYVFPAVVLLQTCLWFWVKDDPFFGDSIASTSKAALAIYDSGFQTFFYPEAVDPGHPTLFPMLMAACWALAGPHLWLSHALSVCCALLLTWSLRNCYRLFMPMAVANGAMLLSCFFATYLSMSAMMLNTTLLMTFCVLAITALLSERKGLFIWVTSLMMLTHLQGAYFLVALAAADCWIAVRVNKQSFLTWIRVVWLRYAIPVIVFTGWLLVHYQHTGWLLHSPNYSDSESLKGMGTAAKGLALITWRLIDYGMLPVYCIVAVALWRKKTDARVAAVFCVMLLVTSAVMAITLEHTIGHRYFLVFQLLAIGIAVGYLVQLEQRYAVIGIGVVWLSLVAGNMLYYPGKTIGDATLAYRSYFTIERQLQHDFGEADTLYSYAPIANPCRSRYLAESGLPVERILSDSLDTYPAVLQSNINAEYTAEQRKHLETRWYGKSYENGAVYVSVFLNPAFHAKPQGWVLREPSWFEQQVTHLKTILGR